MNCRLETMDADELRCFVSALIAEERIDETVSDRKGYMRFQQGFKALLPELMVSWAVFRTTYMPYSPRRTGKLANFLLGPPPTGEDHVSVVDLQEPKNSIDIQVYHSGSDPVAVVEGDLWSGNSNDVVRDPNDQDREILNKIISVIAASDY